MGLVYSKPNLMPTKAVDHKRQASMAKKEVLLKPDVMHLKFRLFIEEPAMQILELFLLYSVNKGIYLM